MVPRAVGVDVLLFRHILRIVVGFGTYEGPRLRLVDRPQAYRTDITALFAVALYGLHPAMAETVNYIIQRGDLYSTMLMVASLALYVLRPNLRKFGIYLLPLASP